MRRRVLFMVALGVTACTQGKPKTNKEDGSSAAALAEPAVATTVEIGGFRLKNVEVDTTEDRQTGARSLRVSVRITNEMTNVEALELGPLRLRARCRVHGVLATDLSGAGRYGRFSALAKGEGTRKKLRAFSNRLSEAPEECELTFSIDTTSDAKLPTATFCWRDGNAVVGSCGFESVAASGAQISDPSVSSSQDMGRVSRRLGYHVRGRFVLRPGGDVDLDALRIGFVCEVGGAAYRSTKLIIPVSAGQGKEQIETFAKVGLELGGDETYFIRSKAFGFWPLSASPDRCLLTVFEGSRGTSDPRRLGCVEWKGSGRANVSPCPPLEQLAPLTAGSFAVESIEHEVREVRGKFDLSVRARITPTARLAAQTKLAADVTCGKLSETKEIRSTDGLWSSGQQRETRLRFFPVRENKLAKAPRSCALRFTATSPAGDTVALAKATLRGRGGLSSDAPKRREKREPRER